MKIISALLNTSFGLALPITLILTGIGCRTPKEPSPQRPPPRPISVIRIGDFQCENAVTAQAVRNVFIEVISLRGDVKLVREGEADVVIEGTVTSVQAGSSSGHIAGGPNWVGGKSQGVGGDYVSGVTALVLRDGQILFSASWGQVMAKGSELLPPELVARRTAERLLGTLYKEGLKRRMDD